MTRDLIGREKLIKAIVNTPTNSQTNTLQGYLDGIATRQLEIIDIINAQPTVDEKEIRDKAIDDFAEKLNNKISEFVLQNKDNLDFASGIAVTWNIVEEIVEKMKEVG